MNVTVSLPQFTRNELQHKFTVIAEELERQEETGLSEGDAYAFASLFSFGDTVTFPQKYCALMIEELADAVQIETDNMQHYQRLYGKGTLLEQECRSNANAFRNAIKTLKGLSNENQ